METDKNSAYFLLFKGEKVRNSVIKDLQPVKQLKAEGKLVGQHMFTVLPDGRITYDVELWMPSKAKREYGK